MRRYALRDDKWERIKDLLAGGEGHVGVTALDNRLFVEALLYRYRAGVPWRDHPQRSAIGRRMCTRFSGRAASGVWPHRPSPRHRCRQRIRGDRQHHCAGPSAQCRCPTKADADQAIGRSRGGMSTMIHPNMPGSMRWATLSTSF